MSLFRPLLVLAAAFAATPAAAQLPRLLPVPAEMHAGQGALSIGPDAAILVPKGDAGARNAANRLADLVRTSRGIELRQVPEAAGAAIRFVRTATGKPESYRLTIAPKGATIAAGDDAGLLYGAVTLWQAMTQDDGRGAVTLPARVSAPVGGVDIGTPYVSE